MVMIYPRQLGNGTLDAQNKIVHPGVLKVITKTCVRMCVRILNICALLGFWSVPLSESWSGMADVMDFCTAANLEQMRQSFEQRYYGNRYTLSCDLLNISLELIVGHVCVCVCVSELLMAYGRIINVITVDCGNLLKA